MESSRSCRTIASGRRRSILAGLVVVMLAVTVAGQKGPPHGEWQYYGGDAGSTRYAPLDQIDERTVQNLRIAWTWKADNFGTSPEFNWQATPLMVDGVLYTTAGTRRDVVAIDAETGETLWMFRYDEGARGRAGPRQNHRGVAYWKDGADERIFYITAGYQLIALNARTGRPIESFGQNGFVDLFDGLDQARPRDGLIGSSSPPLIVKDTVVVGAALSGSSPTMENVAGHVRGYDARTGRRRWIFHTIPRPGEFGNDTWERDSWSYTGNVGVWAPMSADEELGYVYLPVETPTNDLYGGHRHGDNLFADSLVCLDAATGRRIWHYQFVHHGVWDYDTVAPPVLLDVRVQGRPVKIVAQVTKQAFTYVLNRVTGEPIWPIEERPVPQSSVPGERTAPTQPFPTKPPAFDRQGVSLDDLIDFTPALKSEAVAIASQYRLGPLFTPPIVAEPGGPRGVLMLPSGAGGANWQGGAADPDSGLLYVSSGTNPAVLSLRRDPQRSNMDYVGSLGGFGDPTGPGCGMIGPQGLPLIKPPWGRITAIDLNDGSIAWSVPNGDTPDCVRNHPALNGIRIPPTGHPERAGLLVTKTLLFAGEGSGLFATPAWSGGRMFRAHDKRTGAVVWEFALPGSQTGLPMTFMAGGRQYIVVAVGGRGIPAQLVALSTSTP